MGWVTVAAYGVTAALCGAAARRAGTNGEGRVVAFWVALTALYVVLGINKQLDVQSLITEVGRINARAWGWYEHRRTVQALIIVALGLVGAAGVTALAWTAPWRSNERTLALIGTALLVVFVLARATSFSRMDQLIGTEWLGLRANWLLELPGILVTGAGAATANLRQRAPHPPSGSD